MTAFVMAAGLGGPTSAQAVQSCGANGGDHCYGNVYHGASSDNSAFNVEMHANYMTPGCSSASQSNHITAEEWVIMSDGSYLEMGIINSWTYWPDNKVSSPTNAYAFFWSDTDSGHHQYVHTIRNTVPDGTTHTFSIQRTAPGTWAFLLDGSVVGQSGIVHAQNAVQQRIGLEYQGPDVHTCGARADRFEMRPSLYFGRNGWAQWGTYTPGTTSQTFHVEGHLAASPVYVAFWKDA